MRSQSPTRRRMFFRSFFCPAFVLAGCVCLATASLSRAADGPADLSLVYEDNFDRGADRWEPTDKNAWRITDSPRGKAYSLFQQSKYKPPYRSPLNISLLRDVYVGDFVLEVDVLSTTKDYGHRSMCLFFGYQDASHFYYLHLGKKMDDHANQIFIVNEAPRIKISTKTTSGTPWDDKWHHIKIVRRTGDGTINIYFDDMQEPVMTAIDKHFVSGRVGLGSFDDEGDWDNFVLRGVKVEKP